MVGLINMERVLLIRLCKPSMFTTPFTSKVGSQSFFFPLGNLCDPNPSYFSSRGALGETSSVTASNVLNLGSVEPLIRFELVYLK